MDFSTSNKTLEEYNDKVLAKITAPIVYLYVLFVLGVPGNIFIVVIYRNYNKNVYRKVIWVIGLVDLLFCLIGIPFNLTRMYRYYTFFSELSCQIVSSILDTGIMTSTHLLLLLTVYRLRQVCYPLRKQITMQNVSYFIAGCFAIGTGLGIPQLAVLQPLAKTELGNNITGLSCSIAWTNSPQAWKNYNTFLTCLFLLYTLLIILGYALIGRALFIQAKIRKKNLHKAQPQSALNLTLKMTKIAFTVSAVFAVSYLPLFFGEVFGLQADEDENPALFGATLILQRSYLINHVANAFIYFIFDERFRYHIKNILLKTVCVCRVSGHDIEASSGKKPSTSATSI